MIEQRTAVGWIDQVTLDELTKNPHYALAYHRWISVGAPDHFEGRTIPLYLHPMPPLKWRSDEETLLSRAREDVKCLRLSTGSDVHSSYAQMLMGRIEELIALCEREHRQAEHYMDEWSEVCNENQALLNRIEQLEATKS